MTSLKGQNLVSPKGLKRNGEKRTEHYCYSTMKNNESKDLMCCIKAELGEAVKMVLCHYQGFLFL